MGNSLESSVGVMDVLDLIIPEFTPESECTAIGLRNNGAFYATTHSHLYNIPILNTSFHYKNGSKELTDIFKHLVWTFPLKKLFTSTQFFLSTRCLSNKVHVHRLDENILIKEHINE
jgi:hypothetical protein